MAQPRNHKAEYQRRIANAATRGLSRSQARGHARTGEQPAKTKPPASDPRLEAALRELRHSGYLGNAAKSQKIAPERLRRFVRENALAERHGKSWHFTDDRPRPMTVLSDGEAVERVLHGFDQASLNGKHLNAVRQYLSTHDDDLLRSFVGRDVIDVNGVAYPLETDPNALHEIDAQGEDVFHNMYRLTL